MVDDKVGRPPGELWVSKSRTDWSRSCSLGGYASPCPFPLPSPSPVLFFSLPLPFPPFPSLFLLLYPPYLPLVQLWGLGSAGSSLNWVLGGSPSTNAFLTILTPKNVSDNRFSNPDVYYKLPNAHHFVQNSLPAGGQVPLTDWMGPWLDWSVGSVSASPWNCITLTLLVGRQKRRRAYKKLGVGLLVLTI